MPSPNPVLMSSNQAAGSSAAGAGEVSYYRAQTHIAHGNTFSLFVPVANGG